MIKILFVCLGNICRSPMAEFIMKDMAERSGLGKNFEIASAATSSEEYGNPVYPQAAEELKKHKIQCLGKTAVKMTKSDYDHYDFIIGMDQNNIKDIRKLVGGDKFGKIHKLLEFTETPGDISDPWFTRKFSLAYDQIKEGCEGLFLYIVNEGLLY